MNDPSRTRGENSANRRRDERISARVEVRFSARAEAAKALRAYSSNLSAGGLCLRTKRVYDVGESLTLKLDINGEAFDLQAAVAWVRASAIGVRFVNVPPADKERLTKVLHDFKAEEA